MVKNFVTIPQLLKRLTYSNLAEDLDEEKLSQIASRCLQDYEIDDKSRAEWLDKSKEALELAMQVCEQKNFPWENAANVKFPLLTVAALQFHARAYPSVISGNQVVKGQVTGEDPDGAKADKAKRISRFMSWQLLEEMDGWEEGVDRLLICLPIIGCMFKKTCFDTANKVNRSELIFPQDLVINYKAKSLSTVPRITHRFTLYPQQIIEKQMQGEYLDIDLPFGHDVDVEEPQEMLEQHCLIDLDKDGYKEPYIATLHKETGKLLRLVSSYDKDTIFVKQGDVLFSLYDLETMMGITDFSELKLARIAPVPYFTKFSFIPSPDGGIYDLGFGQILLPISASVDTTINQMLDAGTLQNTGGGFVSKSLMTDKKGEIRFVPGEYKPVDNLTGGAIRDAIYQFQHQGPSAATFQLLGLLIQSAKDMTTVQDIMVGGDQQEETATTTLSRVDQGMKLFTAIYKRVYRSLKDEYKKLKRLNRIYLPVSQYFRVLDSGIIEKIGLADFQGDDTDVQPIADPTIASLPMKLAKAKLLKEVSAGNPLYNQREVERRFLEAVEEPNIDAILLTEEQMKQPPDPKLLEVQGKLELIAAQIERIETEKMQIFSQAMKNMAEAESKSILVDHEQSRLEMEQFKMEFEAVRSLLEEMRNGTGTESEQGRVEPMEAEPGNGGGPEIPEGLPVGIDGALGAGGMLGPEQLGENGATDIEAGGEM